jgi:hypothetical protein
LILQTHAGRAAVYDFYRSQTAYLRLVENIRQLSYLAEYTDDIRHIACEENIVADTLPRPPPSAAAGIKEPSGSPEAA